jgi:hypothetical protein
MALGPMAGKGGEARSQRRAQVRGDALSVLEDFDGARRQAHFHRLADQGMGDGVIVTLDFDVIVEMDLGLLPGRVFVALHRQRPQHRFLDRLEDTLPTAVALLEGLGIQLDNERTDRIVERGQAEERHVA